MCEGANCKVEDWTQWGKSDIDGLNATLIDQKFYVSNRPSTVMIQKHSLVSSFRQLKIAKIVNLQLKDEHEFCGPNGGNETSGFSYLPHEFTNKGITYENPGWKELKNVESVRFVLKVVRDICHAEETVLLHCHGGLERSGIVAVCYLIFRYNLTTTVAIERIRALRPFSVPKKEHLRFCERFRVFLISKKRFFSGGKRSFDIAISTQREIYFGADYFKFHHSSRLITEVLHRIAKLLPSCADPFNEVSCSDDPEKWKAEDEDALVELKVAVNKGNWDEIREQEKISLLAVLLFDYLEDNILFVADKRRLQNLVNTNEIQLISSVLSHQPPLESKIQEHYRKIAGLFGPQVMIVLTQISLFFELFKGFADYSDKFKKMEERFCIHLLGYNYKECLDCRDLQELTRTWIVINALKTVLNLIGEFTRQVGIKVSEEGTKEINEDIKRIRSLPVLSTFENIQETGFYAIFNEFFVEKSINSPSLHKLVGIQVSQKRGATFKEGPKSFLESKQDIIEEVDEDIDDQSKIEYDNMCSIDKNNSDSVESVEIYSNAPESEDERDIVGEIFYQKVRRESPEIDLGNFGGSFGREARQILTDSTFGQRHSLGQSSVGMFKIETVCKKRRETKQHHRFTVEKQLIAKMEESQVFSSNSMMKKFLTNPTIMEGINEI